MEIAANIKKEGNQQIINNNKHESSGDSFIPQASKKEDIHKSKDYFSTLKKILDSLKYQIVITIITVYSLFADDIRNAFFDAYVDNTIDSINITIMCLFFIEIVLSSFVIDGYFLSFFFFLDIISTATMIFDINMLNSVIFATSNSSNFSQIASQSKASRAATRAVRIIKLIRVIRIVKLFKNAEKAKEIKEMAKKKQLIKQKNMKEKLNKQMALKKLNENPSHQSNNHSQHNGGPSLQNKKSEIKKIYPQQLHNQIENGQQMIINQKDQEDVNLNDEQIQAALNKQTKIGKMLSQLSIKKIIIVILTLMLIVPLFNKDNYSNSENAWDFFLINQVQLLSNPNCTTSSIQQLWNLNFLQFVDEEYEIISLTSPFNEFKYYNNYDSKSLRQNDLVSSSQKININYIMSIRNLTLISTTNQTNQITAILNQRKLNRNNALFSMSKTLFVCFILFVLIHMFATDIQKYIVEPIQSMMNKLMIMAKDPQAAAKQQLNKNTQLQTTVISNAIIKIGALLSIVFGSAGAEIIGSNIVEQGDMNPMIQGKKKCAIFGFCDIRHFTQITDVLQEQILVFVNKIGSLVHESVYRYGGSANKNIGQAFLLVWIIPEEKYHLDHRTNAIQWKDRRYLGVFSDFSVLGFVKTLIKMHKDPLVLEYNHDPRIKARIPDFQIDMGFGLHAGWAIEGAIGSQYKIDASYLSPNVNMAARLQAATKQFGVDFLLSEELYELLTNDMKKFCRFVDRVTVKGSEKPIRLYTVDLNYDKITAPARKDLKYKNAEDRPDSQSKRQLNMEFLKQEQIDNYNAKQFIKSKKQLREVLIDCLPENFRQRFDLGVNCYIKGKWGDSRLHLCQALKYKSNDGPTKTLLNYMKKSNFNAPTNWKQFRPLTSK